MSISSILRKYYERDHKITLIREIIAKLAIDTTQKQLYYDALDIIDDETLNDFYVRMTGVITEIEQEHITIEQTHRIDMVRRSHAEETNQQNKTKNDNELNILFSNI